MELYVELAQLFMATEATPLVIAGVEFWLDSDSLTFSVPTSKWNPKEMGESVAELAKVYPEVTRIVARFA